LILLSICNFKHNITNLDKSKKKLNHNYKKLGKTHACCVDFFMIIKDNKIIFITNIVIIKLNINFFIILL